MTRRALGLSLRLRRSHPNEYHRPRRTTAQTMEFFKRAPFAAFTRPLSPILLRASLILASCCGLGAASTPPVAVTCVLELFTSQGCSSCPPADALLATLARKPDIVAVSFPVDYWDYIGWKGTLASGAFAARQHAYAEAQGEEHVYTPQIVVDGLVGVVGSDRGAIEAAISGGKGRGWRGVPADAALACGRRARDRRRRRRRRSGRRSRLARRALEDRAYWARRKRRPGLSPIPMSFAPSTRSATGPAPWRRSNCRKTHADDGRLCRPSPERHAGEAGSHSRRRQNRRTLSARSRLDIPGSPPVASLQWMKPR